MLLGGWLVCGQAAEVRVLLWFDTEDFLLPADDDACLRLATMLTEKKVSATFKVVGEKARVLQQRGRADVIAALKKHDIGYHSDLHSVHPTPSEYLAECGWLDGGDEFIRREAKGAEDVRSIFGVSELSCYGQPGSSWAPQGVAALKSIGVAPHEVPVYIDEGEQVGLNHEPFWYAGALNVFNMGENHTRMELHEASALEPAKKQASTLADRLRKLPHGGLISIYYHPCEWVHAEFWDAVNFKRGANPPREKWQAPPQLPAAATEAAFKQFAAYIDYLRTLPEVRFVTASELPELYADPLRQTGASAADLVLISYLLATNTGAINYQLINDRAYSAADQFELLTLSLEQWLLGQKPAFPMRTEGLLGPDNLPPTTAFPARLDWPAFRDATLDCAQFIRAQGRVPARVYIGATPVPPADFLVGLARAYQFYLKNSRLPLTEGVELGTHCQIQATEHIGKDTPELFGGWVIHPEGFRAPKILEQARLQAWTLKPAILVK